MDKIHNGSKCDVKNIDASARMTGCVSALPLNIIFKYYIIFKGKAVLFLYAKMKIITVFSLIDLLPVMRKYM